DTPVECFGLGVATACSIEIRKRNEDNADRWMVAAKHLFAAGERALIKRLRLSIATLVRIQLSQARKPYADICRREVACFFSNCQRLLELSLGLGVASLRAIKLAATIEVIGLIGDEPPFIRHQRFWNDVLQPGNVWQ